LVGYWSLLAPGGDWNPVADARHRCRDHARGIGTESIRSLFDGWLAPLKDLQGRRNIIEPVGSTDHLSFIEAGVPGFNPIQDYANYDIRTHHTNMDTVDRVNVADIRQAAIVMATFAYDAAMADQKIPRPAAK